ncbi:ribonuclease G [Candidatus Photodesmus anomalopis]|uniref:Ribonuclease G n=1 Tax=Candidatus Photodesmus katoptron Akat1 TaxID=1236703 RepID=S3EHS4_9GAMM|nr:ribonuclease G [Candidatus Photodesmus katoptron]EPE37733.1 ribonuclease G [Candidatus Photodesmus katoptron Akat1]
MSMELVLNVTMSETRLAIVKNRVLQEIRIDRKVNHGIVGNIYKGKVIRVLPSMQSAFVNLGLDKPAFLHLSDISVYSKNRKTKKFQVNSISDIIHQGQDIIVQVLKESLDIKRVRLTTKIIIPSKYLIFVFGSINIGISKNISNQYERNRLKKIISNYCDKNFSFIIRSAAEGIDKTKLVQDAVFLKNIWSKVLERKNRSSTCIVLYSELGLTQSILRDFGTINNFAKILVDSYSEYKKIKKFALNYIPELANKVKFYSGSDPIFDIYNIENQIQCSLKPKVTFKSGGYLLIEQTKSMITIDINTGTFVGMNKFEDTILNINIEATKEIVHQLRLRNLGGIIIIDFIDMMSDKDRECVIASLKTELTKNCVQATVGSFTRFGLLEITRKRTRESIENVLCDSCYSCKGKGTIKTSETVYFEILREILYLSKKDSVKEEKFFVHASPEVARILQFDKSHELYQLQAIIGKQVFIQIEPLYFREHFNVVVI